MATSMFDPNTFLNSELKGSLSTVIPPIPDNLEANCIVKSLEIKTPKDHTILEVFCIVDDQSARDATGMKEPIVKYTCFLELTANGQLDTGEGKNTALGRLREALGQNEANKPWSPTMMVGGVFRAKIVQDPDKDDSEKIYNRIKTLTAL